MKNKFVWLFLILLFLAFVLFAVFPNFFGGVSYRKGEMLAEVIESQNNKASQEKIEEKIAEKTIALPPLDTAAYDKKMEELANNPPPPKPTTKIVKDPKTGGETTVTIPALPA